MNLHEYQSKQLFSDFGIPVPKGVLVEEMSQFQHEISQLKSKKYVVKAQVHAGGRGKAGGVVLTDNLEQARSEAERLIGGRLVTKQTGEG